MKTNNFAHNDRWGEVSDTNKSVCQFCKGLETVLGKQQVVLNRQIKQVPDLNGLKKMMQVIFSGGEVINNNWREGNNQGLIHKEKIMFWQSYLIPDAIKRFDSQGQVIMFWQRYLIPAAPPRKLSTYFDSWENWETYSDDFTLFMKLNTLILVARSWELKAIKKDENQNIQYFA